MADNFDTALDVILALEGGFSNHPADPGGATNLGITRERLSLWLGREASIKDVKDISLETASEIYRAHYWNAARCGDLPSGVDLAVFDCAVNQGVGRATRFLQIACGAKIDGVVGPETLAKVREKSVDNLLIEFFAQRMRSYGNLPSLFKTFGLGWSRRLMFVHDKSKSLSVGAPVSRREQVTAQPQNPPTQPTPNQAPTTGQQKGVKPMSLIDVLLGGELLKGRKTVIGIIGYVGLYLLHANGALPGVIDENLYGQLLTLFGGLAGLGLTAKIDRFMQFFGLVNAPQQPQPTPAANPNVVDPFASR